MPRQYNVFGEFMVWVAGGGIFPGFGLKYFQLGLVSESVKIILKINQRDVNIDDFGTQVPAEILYNLTEARIHMTLVHYDPVVLALCSREAMGGTTNTIADGVNSPCGTPMGRGLPVGTQGNHFVSLYLEASAFGFIAPALPWRFPSAYLMDHLEIPLGTEKSLIKLLWRAIPYAPLPTLPSSHGNISSANTVVWDHTNLNLQMPGNPLAGI